MPRRVPSGTKSRREKTVVAEKRLTRSKQRAEKGRLKDGSKAKKGASPATTSVTKNPRRPSEPKSPAGWLFSFSTGSSLSQRRSDAAGRTTVLAT